MKCNMFTCYQQCKNFFGSSEEFKIWSDPIISDPEVQQPWSLEDNVQLEFDTYDNTDFEKPDHYPRTSTPLPDYIRFGFLEDEEDITVFEANCSETELTDEEDSSDTYSPYISWMEYLQEPYYGTEMKKFPIAADDIISGHFNMKTIDPFSYYVDQQNELPLLNKCFINLLINGPPPIQSLEAQNREYMETWIRDCIRPNQSGSTPKMNVNLPIGYKYNENGFVVPSTPSVEKCVNPLDVCIYTG